MQLKLLWDLQQKDLAASALQKKIEEAPALSGVDETSAELDTLEKELAGLEVDLAADGKKLKKLEMDTQKIVDNRKELSESMYGGKVTNVKELEQMQRRTEQFAEQKQKLEDKIITLMESMEEQEATLAEKKAERDDIAAKLLELKEGLARELEQCNDALATLQNERAELVASVEEKYLERYGNLSERHQGKGLAVVESDICGGCRVFISSAQRGHLYNPAALVYCENCGRLLVKLD